MKIEKREKEKVIILIPTGDLVYEGTHELETLFQTLSDDARHVMLDLTYTKYLSARVLGTIVCHAEHYRDKRRGLKLIHVNENIKKLFAITGMLSVIEIFEDEDMALASIGPQVGKLEKMLLWSKECFT